MSTFISGSSGYFEFRFSISFGLMVQISNYGNLFNFYFYFGLSDTMMTAVLTTTTTKNQLNKKNKSVVAKLSSIEQDEPDDMEQIRNVGVRDSISLNRIDKVVIEKEW